MDKTDKIMLSIYGLLLLISLSLFGIGIYVAWHFISKFW